MINKFKKLNKNWLIVLAVVYFFLPIDLIPDVLPGIGWTDDILVIILTGIVKYLKTRKENEKIEKKAEKIVDGELVEE